MATAPGQESGPELVVPVYSQSFHTILELKYALFMTMLIAYKREDDIMFD